MARRSSTSSQPRQAELTPEKIRQGIRRLERRIDEVTAFDSNTIKSDEDTTIADALAASVEGALVQTFGPDTVEYRRYAGAAMFSWPLNMGYKTPIHEIRESLQSCRTTSLALLRQAVAFLKEELGETAELIASAQVPAREASPKKVFVVHGRDSDTKNEVARFLERIGLEAIILHERPNLGRHLLTKFQQEAGDVGFAVVLITPDDEGALVGQPPRKRARQNVVFELGFFIGKLGAAHVAPLVKGDVETPSDFDGIGYIPLDPAGGWKGLLARELKAAKIQFDPAKVFEA